jgi:hypothetical protein
MIYGRIDFELIADLHDDAMVDATDDGDGVLFMGERVLAPIFDNKIFPSVAIEREQRWIMKDLNRYSSIFVDSGTTR